MQIQTSSSFTYFSFTNYNWKLLSCLVLLASAYLIHLALIISKAKQGTLCTYENWLSYLTSNSSSFFLITSFLTNIKSLCKASSPHWNSYTYFALTLSQWQKYNYKMLLIFNGSLYPVVVLWALVFWWLAKEHNKASYMESSTTVKQWGGKPTKNKYVESSKLC